MNYQDENQDEYAIVYLDFDNIWATILDCTKDLLKYNIEDDKQLQDNIKKELENFLNKTLKYLTEKYSIKYIKAFSDFNKLLFSEHVNIVDILHKYGIKTYMPYVRNNKDMSDRALIISAIHDIMSKEPEIEEPKLILFTGDIDYLPLFDYISEYTKCKFEIVSFKNRLSQGYTEVFYTKDNIIILDKILKIDTVKLENDKKFIAFKNHVKENTIDVKKFNVQSTIRNLNREYYFRFEKSRIYEFVKQIKDETSNNY